MEQYKNKREGMVQGYKIFLYIGIILVLVFGIARAIVRREMRKLKRLEKEMQQQMQGSESKTPAEVSDF